MTEEFLQHSSHWGAYLVRAGADGEAVVVPDPLDPAPAAILENVADSARSGLRVDRPHIRRGWLQDRRRHGRGDDDYVPVSWETALDLVGAELSRVIREHGNESIFGGSYGWASAGRFHHSQSQLHRFLNLLGGYTRSLNSYSLGCAEAFMPHVLAPAFELARNGITWERMQESTELVVSFGGMAPKNFQVASGGISQHESSGALRELAQRGCRFVYLSPLRDDFLPDVEARHISIKPFGDTAVLLALAYNIVVERGAHDRDFLRRCTVGFERFESYLRGEDDGTAKTAEWAERLSGVAASAIRELAVDMLEHRTVISVSYSVQRAIHGEQPMWAALTLAAILGRIGEPGCGFALGLGSMGNNGSSPMRVTIPSFPQGKNPVNSAIPVAMMADLLLRPGEVYAFNGQNWTFPDTRLVYWAGGNPFHHCQNLNRLREAFQRPETIIVHEPYWTATARHADIVLPTTVSLERDDFSAGHGDARLVAMKKAFPPFAEARDDFDIFADLSRRLGLGVRFTEGLSATAWVRRLYDGYIGTVRMVGVTAPSFEEFWERGHTKIPKLPDSGVPFAAFRREPEVHPLATPSGKIEIFSEQIDGFGYEDCPGHASWIDTPERVSDEEYLDGGWMQLIANNPAHRLHSQLDFGRTSAREKVDGREPARLHPVDADRFGIIDGDTILLHNARGGVLAGARLSEHVREGCIQLSTGAWFDRLVLDCGLVVCARGNPNTVTSDEYTSQLSRATAGQLAKVRVSKFASATG